MQGLILMDLPNVSRPDIFPPECSFSLARLQVAGQTGTSQEVKTSAELHDGFWFQVCTELHLLE